MTLVKSRKKNKTFQVLKFLPPQKNNKIIKKPKQTGVNFTPKKYYRKKLVKMRNDLIHPSHGCRALQKNPELLIIVSLSSV